MATLTEYEWIPPDEEIEHNYNVEPCLFCGSDGYQEFYDIGGVGSLRRFCVVCVNCNAHGPDNREYQGAVDAWNKPHVNLTTHTADLAICPDCNQPDPYHKISCARSVFYTPPSR